MTEQLKARIHGGDFSERGLARVLGLSQSHLHNVLKGARRLEMQLADHILSKLGITAVDLLTEGELDEALRRKMTLWDAELTHSDEFEFSDLPGRLEDAAALRMPPGQARSRTTTRGNDKSNSAV